MTSGNKTINKYQTVNAGYTSCTSSGTTTVANVGSRWTKTWTGGDTSTAFSGRYIIRRFTYRVTIRAQHVRKKFSGIHKKDVPGSKFESRQANGSYSADGEWFSYDRVVYVREFAPGLKPKWSENGYTMNLNWQQDNVYNIIDGRIVCTNGNRWTSPASTFDINAIGPTESSLWTSNDDISLIGKLSDKISGEQFNMLVFLGEGKESLQTVADAATRLAKAMYALKHGNVKRAARYLLSPKESEKFHVTKHVKTSGNDRNPKWLADNWLNLQYGWMPLVQDIWGAMSHFAHMQNRPQELTYRSSKRKESKKLLSNSTSYTVAGDAFMGKTIKAKVSKINELTLLGLTDPLSLAWERLPYSFICDWIIPVGNYLQAINLNRALTATYVTSSLYRLQSTSASSTITGVGFSGAQFDHKTIICRRTISSSLNVPLPTVKPWEKIATWRHAANAAALLSNVFR